MSKKEKGGITAAVVANTLATPVFCYGLMCVGYFMKSAALARAGWVGFAVTLILWCLFAEVVVQAGLLRDDEV